jgi:hypothetical protein
LVNKPNTNKIGNQSGVKLLVPNDLNNLMSRYKTIYENYHKGETTKINSLLKIFLDDSNTKIYYKDHKVAITFFIVNLQKTERTNFYCTPNHIFGKNYVINSFTIN